MNQDHLTEKIKEISVQDAPRIQGVHVLQHAAVLLPLVKKEGDWHLLFEERSQTVDLQPGDICFPGGHTEKGEHPKDTVLREVREELFVGADHVEILAELPEVLGPRNTVVTPFSGILHDYTGDFDRAETARVFTVPLTWFQTHDPLIHRDIPQKIADDFPYELVKGGRNYPFYRPERVTFFYEHDEGVIWGFTAGLIRLFLTLLA